MRIKNLLAAAALAGAASLAQAVVVQSSFFNSAGTTWIGQFDVYNDGSVPSVESFTIYFDYGKATNLMLLNAPGWWDTIVVQPDDALTAPGFVDALQLDPALGLGVGVNLKGFSVEFDWSGADAPGPFAFSINDPVTFQSLEGGLTTPGGAAPIPEPSTWALLGLGLAAIGFARATPQRRRWDQNPAQVRIGHEL
jgi:hypothetical protein